MTETSHSSALHRLALGTLLSVFLGACGKESTAKHTPPQKTVLEDLQALGYASGPAEELGPFDSLPKSKKGAAPGWNLFTDQASTVFFVDAEGHERRRFVVPGRSQVEHVEPTSDGFLTVSVDQGWDLFDSAGNHLWDLDGNAHHDAAVRPGGGFYVLVWEERLYSERRVRFDSILAVSQDGEIEGVVWNSFAHQADLASHHKPLPLDSAGPPDEEQRDKVYDYFHINTVEVLDDRWNSNAPGAAGDLLLCARNASLVFLVERASGAILWSFGPGVLDFPHAPTLGPEGQLLIFDNGWHRGWSRGLEIDVLTKEILWQYKADPPAAFFTKTRGSIQRLSNGNTLLCEADRGRAFEVTREGKRVWTFLNFLDPGSTPSDDRSRRRLYRFTRWSLVGSTER